MEPVGVFTIGMLGRGRRGSRNADGYVKFLLAADTFRYLVMVIHVCVSPVYVQQSQPKEGTGMHHYLLVEQI